MTKFFVNTYDLKKACERVAQSASNLKTLAGAIPAGQDPTEAQMKAFWEEAGELRKDADFLENYFAKQFTREA